MKPHVGLIFWKRLALRGWIRHEVRAIVDEQMVIRHWAHKWGGVWAYEVEALYIWDKVWMRESERGQEEPFVTLDGKTASDLNRKHGFARELPR